MIYKTVKVEPDKVFLSLEHLCPSTTKILQEDLDD